MNPTMVEVQGTLLPDGTLTLDSKPDLPAGRVRVTLQAVEPAEGVIELLRRIHAEQAARGYVSPSAEEIDAGLRDFRAGVEERFLQLERLQQWCESQKRADPTGNP